MDYINSLVELLRKSLSQKRTWIIFPFTIFAVVLSAIYFVFSAVYMLIDLLVIEMRKELSSNNENVGGLAMAFKYLITYSIYSYFYLVKTVILVPMAIIYFLINIFLFISSVGEVKECPFKFHTL